VASFFVSRIDTQIDKEIDRLIEAGAGVQMEGLKALRGKVAIANAKIAYQHYLALLESPRWRKLAMAGGTPQRLLWASTGTKDPAYSELLYVESLIGPDTINTLPVKTLDAFRAHGRVRSTLVEDADEAHDILDSVERLGLDLNGVTERLLLDGVRQFILAFEKMLRALAEKRIHFEGGKRVREGEPVVYRMVPKSTSEGRSANRTIKYADTRGGN
jgi:transaldolase/glucose-6-phosphate isomerase